MHTKEQLLNQLLAMNLEQLRELLHNAQAHSKCEIRIVLMSKDTLLEHADLVDYVQYAINQKQEEAKERARKNAVEYIFTYLERGAQ